MLKRYGNQLLYFCVAFVFFLVFATVYGLSSKGRPMYKSLSIAGETKPTIKANTIIRKEIRYMCNDKVSTKIPTTSDIIGLDFSKLVEKYPPEEGWRVDDSVKNNLILVHDENRVCPYHQDFRHLGIGEGYMVVYEGPLGYNQKVLQRDDIKLISLPPEMQVELNLATDYNNQSADIQGRLKLAYEFETEAQINSVLENFDEYKQ